MSQKGSAIRLIAVTLLFWFSMYGYTPYVNPELERMGVTAVFMGFVSGAYGLTQLVLRLPLGVAADRLGTQKLFICVGCLCVGLSALGMYLFYSPVSFLLCRGLSGVAASSWVSFTVLYSSYYGGSAQAITMLNAANLTGRLLSFFAASAVVVRADSRAAFLLSGLAGLIALVVSLSVREEKSEREPIRLSQLPGVIREPNLIVTSMLAIFVQVVAFATLYSFTSNYAVSIGIPQAQLGYLNIALTAPYIAGNFLAGKYLMGRFGVRRLVALGFALMGLYCCAVPLVATPAPLFALQAVAGVGYGLSLPVLMGCCVRNISPDRRTTAMGFFQATYGVGMTAGPVVMGGLVDAAGLGTGFRIIGAVALVLAAGTIPLLRRVGTD